MWYSYQGTVDEEYDVIKAKVNVPTLKSFVDVDDDDDYENDVVEVGSDSDCDFAPSPKKKPKKTAPPKPKNNRMLNNLFH